MEDHLFIDIGYNQQKKHGQNAYGDTVLSQRYPSEGRLIAVLSDGLGSGIKANILSQMTATMILKFIEEGNDILKSSELVMDSLPTCRIRKISYSTFSIADCNDDGHVKVIEEGNPSFLWIRDNQILNPEPSIITSKKFTQRHLHIYNIKLEENDRLIFCSDGVTQAGLGGKNFKLGWRREGLAQFTINKLKQTPNIDSSQLAKNIVHAAELKEENKKAKDDISSVILYFRKPRISTVFTGPPYHSERDREYVKIFAASKGKKIVCGGTTANLVSRELNRPIDIEPQSSGILPACSKMDGIDLVTEGILTLTKTAEFLENGDISKNNSAGKLIKLLLDSDCIKFMIGSSLNQAHNDPNLPVELEIRKNVIKRIAKSLKDKYIKKVELQFI